VIELDGGGFVLFGLLARVAALWCSGAMAFAYFTVHQPQALLPLQTVVNRLRCFAGFSY
jgi:putative oxidoreductase